MNVQLDINVTCRLKLMVKMQQYSFGGWAVPGPAQGDARQTLSARRRPLRIH